MEKKKVPKGEARMRRKRNGRKKCRKGMDEKDEELE
jgi:hypothetical protein